jgi:hypothetical protein
MARRELARFWYGPNRAFRRLGGVARIARTGTVSGYSGSFKQRRHHARGLLRCRLPVPLNPVALNVS